MAANGNLATPDFILHPSAFILIERHAKINEAGKLKQLRVGIFVLVSIVILIFPY